jgi:hypothetical protein
MWRDRGEWSETSRMDIGKKTKAEQEERGETRREGGKQRVGEEKGDGHH